MDLRNHTIRRPTVPVTTEQKTRQVPESTTWKSFAEVVKQSKNDRKEKLQTIPGKGLSEANMEPINIQTSSEKLKWLDNAWVGCLKNKGMFDRVDVEVQGLFGPEIKVAYWGDDKIIISDMDDETANKLILDEQQHGGTPFSSLKRWTPELKPSHCLTWIRIWGVPLMAWDAENFASIVSVCGDLVELDPTTEDRSRVDIARLLIRTEETSVIDNTVAVVVDGTHYLLQLREEWGCAWGGVVRGWR